MPQHWTPEEYWEYVGGLAGDFERDQMRTMLSERGLVVGSAQGASVSVAIKRAHELLDAVEAAYHAADEMARIRTAGDTILAGRIPAVAEPAQQPIGYISPKTLEFLTETACGTGPVVACAGYDTIIPVYTAARTPAGCDAQLIEEKEMWRQETHRLREQFAVTEDVIKDAWANLEGHGFPPEACSYLPAAIDSAISCMAQTREDLIKQRDQALGQVEEAAGIIDDMLGIELGSAERGVKFIEEHGCGHPHTSTVRGSNE
jgi:hypothetical protein